MTKKYILTGGPGVGKSTTLAELKKRGYYILNEAATHLIEMEQRKEGGKLPWTDRDGFQKKVLETQLQWEKEIPPEIGEAFLDRSIIDGLAYYNIDSMQPPKELEEAIAKAHYDCIFMLEPLQNYERNSTRREDPKLAKKIHEEIYKTYCRANYNPTIIPSASPQERVQMIVNKTKRKIN